ncbi:hypothetical protein L1080_003925 [Rhodococcus sp. MSC1_016]|jgi:hypothetical protein|uniref:hypothetical protein n=1 Tax=Rhodococcus sp. MSC1_016 TaxID=2909266 RepID=UPI00202DE88D|nr:hypothetical protein [Rhodococcus sp. MSC1_016]
MARDPEPTDDHDWQERGLRMAADVGPGMWIVKHVHRFNEHAIASLVPPVFDSYARIFHPAMAIDGEPVRWTDVAVANGTTAHPAMEWGSLVGSWHTPEQPGVWQEAPEQGSLPPRTARSLVGVLRRFTQTPDTCWFAHWQGSGRITAPENYPRLPMPSREDMVLFSGDIDLADTQFGGGMLGMSAHLWWPEDRAWCVATDIDLMTTYLGASAECVEAVLTAPELEALPATSDQKITWDSDTVNPLPGSPSSGF